MKFKSRLVALGNQEQRQVRSDSPTADAKGLHLVFSIASSSKATVRCGDLESAYLTGEGMSRVLLLRQPRSGLPGLKPDDRLLALVPVYGTQDAARGFWIKFRRTLIAGGVRENRVLSAENTLTVDGQLQGIVATHVDDLLYAFDGPVGQGVIDHIKQHLILSKESECNFSFCGRELRQDAENGDYSVHVICEATTRKTNEIRFEGCHVHVRKTAHERLTASEQEQYESVTGSLKWVARIARVDPQAAVSRLQQMKKQATVAAAVFANKVVQYLKKTATRGLVFLMGVISWHLGDFVIGSVCDASHADEHCERTGEPYRSQGGRMTILATRSFVDQTKCGFHLTACASNTLKRVCRSTLTAETYQMELGVEAADQLRAAIVDMFEHLSRKQWVIEATSAIQLVWVTDCDSCRSALVGPTMDKRLGITIASLRQAIWRRRGEAIGAPMVTDTLPSSSDATDVCRWVDTDCMLVDALTKQMSPEKLVTAVNRNYWNLEQPIGSILRKRDKQRQRAAGKNQQKEKKEQQMQRQLNDTRVEGMRDSDPESCDDDGPGILIDAD